jgi:hypothetical protein
MSRWSPWVSLVAVAALAGYFWRLEVEHHGWAGLAWTRYFHLAIPVGIALFLAWVAWWVDVPTRTHRIRAVAMLALYALLAAPLTEWSLRALTFAWAIPRIWLFLLLGSLVVHPMAIAGVLTVCHAAPGWRRWAVGQTLFVLSPVLATQVMTVFPQHHHTDFIHAIKSGMLAPFLVVALGLVVPVRKTLAKAA